MDLDDDVMKVNIDDSGPKEVHISDTKTLDGEADINTERNVRVCINPEDSSPMTDISEAKNQPDGNAGTAILNEAVDVNDSRDVTEAENLTKLGDEVNAVDDIPINSVAANPNSFEKELASSPDVASNVDEVKDTPSASIFPPVEEDLRGMKPVDVIRRRAMPGSPELKAYIQSLNDYNHEAFARNHFFVEQLRLQSEMEIDAYSNYVLQEETQRQARLEAAIILFVFYIPPIWKRAIAELIDFTLLLVIKLVVTWLIMDSLNITTNVARMNFYQWIDNPQLAAQVSAEVALLEIPFRIIVILYETFFTVKCAGTPGKRWMGMRLIHVRELAPMDGDVLREDATRPSRTCVRVNPAEVLPLRFALMRAVLKNAFVGLLMSPVCFSFIFVNQNRTGYDVMTNSMVVEYKPNIHLDGPIWN